MSLLALPEEMLEVILLYVDVEDILNVLTVVGNRGSEGFWKRVSLKNGYKKLPEDTEWKCVFLRNVNWLKGCFVEHEYNISDLSKDKPIGRNEYGQICLDCDDSSTHQTTSENFRDSIFLKSHTLIFQKHNELLVMDVETPKNLLQKLPGKSVNWCNASESKLLVKTPNSLTVYSLNAFNYEETFVWDLDCGFPLPRFFLSDDYFVGLTLSKEKCMTVVNLNTLEKYSQPFSEKGEPCSFDVCDHILNFICLDGQHYVLRRFHLQKREKLKEVHMFQNAAMIQIPQIRINQRAFVSWAVALDNWSTMLLKCWRSQDSTHDSFNVVKTTFLGKSQQILWLLLETDYVIFSTSKDVVSIVDLKDPESEMFVKIQEHGYLGQNIISDFLVLSYTNCLKLVDIKSATYVQQISFKSSFKFNRFRVNACFYIVYNDYEDKGNGKLCIYDFRCKIQ
ncbi:uncharacterized protein LOC129001169 [Macrosteles quadrilineatus]|uniref:uncharacterized protein LOC129001169 n=1 Tax=Macrosteles quadrilineatus TaxID=74068 RepID=UPI0023E0CE78|nr:uncharacterized protein LOC129001169 [Macrosteles quadrilineatus]